MEYLLEFFILILSVIIAVYVGTAIKKKKIIDSRAVIPGLSKTHPRLGNLGELGEYGSLHKFLEHLHKEYGKVASFYWNDTKIVSICDYTLFKNVKHLFNRPHIIFDNFKSFIGEECIQFANGIEARDRRKCYDQSFSQEAVIRYIETMAKIGNQEIEVMISSPTSTIESVQLLGLTMSIKAILQCCILPDTKEQSFYLKMIHLYNIVWDGLTSRLIDQNIFNETDFEEIKFREAQKEFNSIITDIVKSRTRLLDEDIIKDTDGLLIDYMIYFHGDINTEVTVRDVVVYLIGGFHTSGNLFGWCLYYLAKNAEFQEHIFEEIYRNKLHFSNTKECLNTINNMPFLKACINETLRLSELAPFAARVSNEDISLGPYFIRANTPIILSLGVAHSNTDVYNNAALFNPYRFLDVNLPSLSFVPFGFAGKRKCPGEIFAYLEVSIWLIQFIKNYRFTLRNPDEEVKKVYGIVTHMDRAVSVVFEHR